MVADFGKVISAVPQIHFHNGVAGRALTMQTAYLPVNTTLSAATAAGATNVKVASVTELRRRRQDHDRRARPGLPDRRPGDAHDHRGRNDRSDRHRDHPRRAAQRRDHASGKYVAGTRASTASIDNQGSTMTWFYTEKDGDQTAQAFTYWGWRYLQINAPGAGETLTADDISAVLQHTDAPGRPHGDVLDGQPDRSTTTSR